MMSDAPATDYDQLPYISMPVVYSQPSRLAALAALHGLSAPDAARARVLELGCAAGGNIIPLAARHRQAHFLGLDLSRAHVDEANRRIASLALRNIEIRQADITTAAFAGASFDYVICHGVFSWVPMAAQNAIFAICNRHLADRGMAVISYNVLPGWHLRNVIRSLCLQHAGAEGTPKQRVGRARAILDEVVKATDASAPYGHVVRSEAARIAKQPASYILGEFLSPDNAPCTFRQFVERAQRHDLAWLCEADLPSTAPDTFAPKAAAKIRAIAGNDVTALQAYTDMFSGRTFRRSVLVKAKPASGRQIPGPERLQGLYFAGALTPDPKRSSAGVSAFTDHRGRSVTANNPAVGRALTHLAARYPATASVSELVGSDDPQGENATRVAETLFKLVASGQAVAASLPLRCGTAAGPRPRVWPLARAEAASGQPWVTSLRHTAVLLNPVLRVLLPHLDGEHDRVQLAARLAAAQAAGTIETVTADTLAHALSHLAVNALLEPD
jgi:SAM-dependent methyltransferase